MTDLTSLIERVEAATEGSRELDREIARALGWGIGSDLYVVSPDGVSYGRVPHFTSSIDAALTLLPLGYEYDLTNIYGVARVSVGLNCEPGPFYGANECGSVPLALLAAILCARQTEARG